MKTSLTLQAWDSKWEEYVDVDDVDSLPDSCKLAATVQLASVTILQCPQDSSDLGAR